MKYMKKALAAVSAVLICVSSAVPFTASAKTDLVDKCKDALDEITGSWNRDKVVEFLSKAYNRALIAYENGEGKYYQQIYLGTTIVPKDAATFSVDEINAKLDTYKVEYKDGKYTINISDPADKAKVYNILKESKEIASVTEEFKVLKAGFWAINSVQLNVELTEDELTGVFKALNLKLVAETDDNFSSDTVKKYVYKITDPLGIKLTDSQFEALRDLMKKECYLDIDYSSGTQEDETKFISVSIFDDSDVLYGDITGPNGEKDGDGEIDMTDLICLSQALLGDITLTTEQQQRADVVKDKDVNLADLSTLKQYIMKDKVVLGK